MILKTNDILTCTLFKIMHNLIIETDFEIIFINLKILILRLLKLVCIELQLIT